MTLPEIQKEIQREFSDFMVKIAVIEVNLGKMQSKLQDKIDEANSEVEYQKKESKILEDRQKELEFLIEQSKSTLRESQEKKRESDSILRDCKEKEAQIFKRQELLARQEASVREERKEADKRLAWAEMEDRRIRFLQKKIDLVTQDAEIKKKLKEIE